MRQLSRQQVLHLVCPAPDRLRIAGRKEHEAEEKQRAAADNQSARAHQAIRHAIGDRHSRIEKQHERRQHQDDGHAVEQSFDDNRREGGGCAESGLTRQQIRPNDLSRAGRQHRADRKSDHRRAKGRTKSRDADRRQQVLPPYRAQRGHHHRRYDGYGDQPRICLANFVPDDVEMSAPEKNREQPKRQGDENGRA